ncbi:sigma 54-interacting transcriptional regulator [Chondromyces crocatus]|uniref:sigma 54-interacting transcriptional regulator n=1 Tax=Chondromyces crocatus TaxID=52 RepID=UPI001FE18C76|nr:sigma 54-interacting transcriptional regulator [Chondromyces crocatus]
MLLVEDEPDQAAILEAVLRHEGLEVVVASSGEQALEVHQRTPADVLVTDLNLPGMTGVDLMRRLNTRDPEAPEPKVPPPAVVMVTGSGSIASAVDALKLGAADYLQKPLDPARLVSLVRELLRSDGVPVALGDEEDGQLVFEGMIGGSQKMRDVFARIERVGATMAPVLIVGESGTGKELVARAIHNRSRRRNGPFVPVHTGAIPRELIGSELFGHEKGSFTGAFSAAEGKFEAAAGGTIFLDEVGTMDSAVQVSLLRVLETYRFTRVGGRKEIEADVRVVAATNKDLLDLVDENVFREDLYYRLNVFTITLPPLRERREDVHPIGERYLVKFARRYGTPARRLSEAAIQRLGEHDWPGNVRELRNVMEQTALFAPGEIVGADDVQIGQGRIERRAGHAHGPRSEAQGRAPVPSSTAGVPSGVAASWPGQAPPRSEAGPGSWNVNAAWPQGRAPEGGTPPSINAGTAPLSADGTISGWAAPTFDPQRTPGTLVTHLDAGAEPATLSSAGPVTTVSSTLVGEPRIATPMPVVATPPLGQVPRTAEGGVREHEPTRESGDAGEHPLVLRLPVGTRLADAERQLILLTLEAVRGNKQRAARVLGISRRGLYSKLQAYGEHVGGQEAQGAPEAAEPQEAGETEPQEGADEVQASTEEHAGDEGGTRDAT